MYILFLQTKVQTKNESHIENADGKNAQDEMNIPAENNAVTSVILATFPPNFFRTDLVHDRTDDFNSSYNNLSVKFTHRYKYASAQAQINARKHLTKKKISSGVGLKT